MFGRNHKLNPLESRKRRLLVESELNRVQLLQEWQRLKNEGHQLVQQAGYIGSIISAATSLVAGFRSLLHKKAAAVEEKPSWLKTILNGASSIASLWPSFRAPTQD